MNERIRELAEQAGIDFFNSTDPEYFGRVYCEGWLEQQQKFAELIVRECGNYLMSDEFIGRSDLDWSIILNDRFGVK
jgi:hypothetical protein